MYLKGSCDDFLLGNWLENAKEKAKNNYEAILYEYGARNQVISRYKPRARSRSSGGGHDFSLVGEGGGGEKFAQETGAAIKNF